MVRVIERSSGANSTTMNELDTSEYSSWAYSSVSCQIAVSWLVSSTFRTRWRAAANVGPAARANSVVARVARAACAIATSQLAATASSIVADISSMARLSSSESLPGARAHATSLRAIEPTVKDVVPGIAPSLGKGTTITESTASAASGESGRAVTASVASPRARAARTPSITRVTFPDCDRATTKEPGGARSTV